MPEAPHNDSVFATEYTADSPPVLEGAGLEIEVERLAVGADRQDAFRWRWFCLWLRGEHGKEENDGEQGERREAAHDNSLGKREVGE
jgi:hypothetical protein